MSYFSTLLSAKAYTLRLPQSLKDDIDRCVQQHQQGGPYPERAPFRRRLDLWAYSIATAVAEGLEPIDAKRALRGQKFVDTRSVQMPEELCGLLAVVAAAWLGPDHERVTDPAKIMEIGNRFAAAGCPVVIGKMQDEDLRLTQLAKVRAHAESMLEREGLGSGEAVP